MKKVTLFILIIFQSILLNAQNQGLEKLKKIDLDLSKSDIIKFVAKSTSFDYTYTGINLHPNNLYEIKNPPVYHNELIIDKENNTIPVKINYPITAVIRLEYNKKISNKKQLCEIHVQLINIPQDFNDIYPFHLYKTITKFVDGIRLDFIDHGYINTNNDNFVLDTQEYEERTFRNNYFIYFDINNGIIKLKSGNMYNGDYLGYQKFEIIFKFNPNDIEPYEKINYTKPFKVSSKN